MKSITVEDIPKSFKMMLDEYNYYEDDVNYSFFSPLSEEKFDKVMLCYGFYEEEYSEYGNRIITQKAKKYGYDKIIQTILN